MVAAYPTEHPRARGENYTKRFIVRSTLGTSPRTRGKLSGYRIGTDLTQEHPRARGENLRPGEYSR